MLVICPELAYGCWWMITDIDFESGRRPGRALVAWVACWAGLPFFSIATVFAFVALFRPPRFDVEADRLVIRGMISETRVLRADIAQIVRLTDVGPPAVAILCKPGRAPFGWGRWLNQRYYKVDLTLPTNLNISDAKLHALLTDWLAQP